MIEIVKDQLDVGLVARQQIRSSIFIDELLHDAESLHGVGAVDHRPTVGRGDARLRETTRQRGAADQDRCVDAGRPKVLGGDHHLVG